MARNPLTWSHQGGDQGERAERDVEETQNSASDGATTARLAPLAGGGTRLTFTTLPDGRDTAARNAAGWEVCLDALDAAADGRPADADADANPGVDGALRRLRRRRRPVRRTRPAATRVIDDGIVPATDR